MFLKAQEWFNFTVSSVAFFVSAVSTSGNLWSRGLKNILNSDDSVEAKLSQAFRVKPVSFFFSAPGTHLCGLHQLKDIFLHIASQWCVVNPRHDVGLWTQGDTLCEVSLSKLPWLDKLIHQSVCRVREPRETLYDGAVRSAINSFHVLLTSSVLLWVIKISTHT